MKIAYMLIVAAATFGAGLVLADGCLVDAKRETTVCLDSNNRLLQTLRRYGGVTVARGPQGELIYATDMFESKESGAKIHVDAQLGIVTIKSFYAKDGYLHEETTIDGGPRNGYKDSCTRRDKEPPWDDWACTNLSKSK